MALESPAAPEARRAGTRAAAARAELGATSLLLVLAALTLLRVGFIALEPYPLDPEEAQYWSYGEAPAFGYYSKPPLLPWLIALSTSLLGDTAFGVRVLSPFLHALTAWFLYLAGRRLFDAPVGVLSALLYATMPGVSLSSGLMTTDVPMLLAWSVALYAFVRALEQKGLAWWLATGAAIGVGLLGKYTMIAFVASALLFLLLSPRDRRALRTPGPPLALATALVVLSPNLLWNAGHGFATIAHVGDNASLGGDLFHPDQLLEFLGAQLGIANPIVFAVLLLLIAGVSGAWRRRRFRLLLCFAAPLLLVITLESFLTRAHGNWAAPAYLSAVILVAAWLWETGRALWLKLAIGSNVLILAIWMVYGSVLGVAAERLPSGLDPLARLRGSPEMGRELQAVRARLPETRLLVDDRQLMALILFYARVPMDEVAKWNPNRIADNHYDLVAALAPDAEGPFVLISDRADPSGVLRHFDSAQRLPPIVVRTHANREARFTLHRLDGFTGYGPAAP